MCEIGPLQSCLSGAKDEILKDEREITHYMTWPSTCAVAEDAASFVRA
jgi:hypothetical protein